MESQEVIGTRQAAEMLGVSVRTVQLWVEKGVLQAWKTVGGHRRILRSSVEAALVSRAGDRAAADTAEKLKVLIVDDDPVMQTYYVAMFEILRPDAEIAVAVDGFEGLVRLGEIHPRLMLVDIDMPNMDGVMMLNRIRSDDFAADMLIAVVTGLGAEQLATRGQIPADIPVYAKPLSSDDLADLLEKLDGTSADQP